MKKLVECVPNFSEGRNRETIDAIAAAIAASESCRLLDVDPGSSTNRTVYTFVGEPDAVLAGALAAAKVARDRIDMRSHKGEHPRFGAMDVCPFVPVQNIDLEECAALARRFGAMLAEELGLPCYFYGAAGDHDYRRSLAALREKEYEGLAVRLADSRWQPDCGPAEFNPRWGISAVGARNFLIAYNVNILGTANQAHRIALNLREAGRGDGVPGRLQAVKGMGWYLDEQNIAQVSVNLEDYQTTPPHVLFEAVREEAEKLSVGVAGSEIVGLIPLAPLLMAADYYIAEENLFIYQEDQKVRLAVERLGLSALAPFVPKEKIIEYRVMEPPFEPLAAMSLRGFIEELGSRSSAPGGGSASAVLTAMGVGLGAMVGKLTHGVRKFEQVQPQMQEAIPPLHTLMQALIPMIDADTNAFTDYVAALKMSKETEEEKRLRREAMEAGLKHAIEVPLTTMRLGDKAWEAMEIVARYGNPASRSDIMVGAAALATGIWGEIGRASCRERVS
jgi:glutamate formiminotransferase/formiminotetrahydrofolate cyclodeaminase